MLYHQPDTLNIRLFLFQGPKNTIFAARGVLSHSNRSQRCPGTAHLRLAPRLRRDRFCRHRASRRLCRRRRPQDTSGLENAAAGGPHLGSDLGLLCPRPQGKRQRRHLHRSRRDKNRRRKKPKNTKNRKKTQTNPKL